MEMNLPIWPQKSLYAAVSPLGTPSYKTDPIALRLTSLEGKKIGLVWNGFGGGDVLLEAFAGLLANQVPDIEFIKLPSSKTESWGIEPHGGTTGEVAKEAGVDAAIVAAGG